MIIGINFFECVKVFPKINWNIIENEIHFIHSLEIESKFYSDHQDRVHTNHQLK